MIDKQPPQPSPDQGAPAAPVASEQLAEFARYWQSHSVCFGFPQVWVDTETGGCGSRPWRRWAA